MKTISIRNPWAWATIHAGKPVENRTWPSRYTGPLLIHASKTFDHSGYNSIIENRGRLALKVQLPHPDNYEMGGIIGQVNMIDCVDYYSSPWFTGPWGFVFTDPRPLRFHPCKGQVKMFNVDYPF